MFILLLHAPELNAYFSGSTHKTKDGQRINHVTTNDWQNAIWFDNETDLRPIIKRLYMRFMIDFEVERKFIVL